MPATQFGLNSVGSQRIRACTECKQSKLKCDSKKTFPNPCSRCHTRNLVCLVDSSFRRTPARKRVESMRRELEQLRSQRCADSWMPKSNSSLEPDSSRNSDHGAAYAPINHNFELECSVVSLDGINVSPTLAVDALRLFATFFLPQFPIIGTISATDLYGHRPLLFWTILIIVFSHHREIISNSLYHDLTRCFVGHLQGEITAAPLPLFKIHVLLLLIIWPLPVARQAHDPGLLYSGIAIQAARYIGIDRDAAALCSIGINDATSDASERINTWIGCFYATTSLSLQLRLRPPIDSDVDLTTIQNFLRQSLLNNEFQSLVTIQIIVAKYTSLPYHNTLNQGGYSLILRLVESELDVLQAACRETGTLTKNITLSILDVKLHFYTCYMTKLSSGASSNQATCKNALLTALRVVQLCTMPESSSPAGATNGSDLRQRKSMQKGYYRRLSFATVILLKFFYHNSAALKEEQHAAITHIGLAQNLYRECSYEDDDEYAKTAESFEYITRLRQDEVGSMMMLQIDHLMGVPMCFDGLSTSAEIPGRPGEVYETEAWDNEQAFTQYHHPGSDQMSLLQNKSTLYEHEPSTIAFPTTFWDMPVPHLVMDDVIL